MEGRVRLVYNTALKHVTAFKSAVIKDVVVSALLVQLIGVVSIIITENYDFILMVSYFLLWPALFSRHSFRIMPASKKTRLFLFGLFFLFITTLLVVFSAIIVDGILPDCEAASVLKIFIASLMLPFVVIYYYPSLLKRVVPKEHKVSRYESRKRPYYMFPTYFVVFFIMIILPHTILYVYPDSAGTVEWIFIYAVIDIAFFLSAIVVSSLFFAVYKKGYSHT